MADFIEQIENEEGDTDSLYDNSSSTTPTMISPRRVSRCENIPDTKYEVEVYRNSTSKRAGTMTAIKSEPQRGDVEKYTSIPISLSSSSEIQWQNYASDNSHVIWPVPTDVYSLQDLRDTMAESYRVSGESTELLRLLDSEEHTFEHSWQNTYEPTKVSPCTSTAPQSQIPESQSSCCTENSQLSSEFDLVDLIYIPTSYHVTPTPTLTTYSGHQHCKDIHETRAPPPVQLTLSKWNVLKQGDPSDTS